MYGFRTEKEVPMSIVIVGGNERMERQYSDLCKAYSCKAKVFTKNSGKMKCIGSPDLIVVFTSTVSHKMLRSVEAETKGQNVNIVHSPSASMSALKSILNAHVGAMA